MKMTQNRRLILRLLDDNIADCGNAPPYSASELHYALHFQDYAKWYAEQDGLTSPTAKPPSIQQIHRTLKDLAAQGLIVYERRINDRNAQGELPQLVSYWQLAGKVEFNVLAKARDDAHNKADRGT